MWANRDNVYREIKEEKGHLYVCGEVSMAEGVVSVLVDILEKEGGFTRKDAENYVEDLKVLLLLAFSEKNLYQ